MGHIDPIQSSSLRRKRSSTSASTEMSNKKAKQEGLTQSEPSLDPTTISRRSTIAASMALCQELLTTIAGAKDMTKTLLKDQVGMLRQLREKDVIEDEEFEEWLQKLSKDFLKKLLAT